MMNLEFSWEWNGMINYTEPDRLGGKQVWFNEVVGKRLISIELLKSSKLLSMSPKVHQMSKSVVGL